MEFMLPEDPFGSHCCIAGCSRTRAFPGAISQQEESLAHRSQERDRHPPEDPWQHEQAEATTLRTSVQLGAQLPCRRTRGGSMRTF